jgi:hypothetical protein
MPSRWPDVRRLLRVPERRLVTTGAEFVPGDIDQTFACFEDALDISAQ